ncbi:PAS domain S-box protein [Natronoarchaeum mannanilyticum]|uniref:histidine kinase n=1 Tax=Natronoarchaeum mannanilyticum TaxID=926360 RepID=A0AAV3TDK4_9EURY
MRGDDRPLPDGLYRTIFEEADIGIAINDPENGTFGDVNPRYAEMLGYDADELRDTRIDAISAEDPSFDQEAAEERLQRVLEGEPQKFDWLFERKDGTEIWTEVSLKRTTVDGNVRVLAFVRDITESKERKWDLEFFEELVETIGVGVGVYRADGTIEYVNERFAENLDADRDALRGVKIWEINPDVDPDRFDEYWASFDDGETRTAETVHSFEGSEVPVETVTTCKEINDTLYHFGTVQDISDRKEQEERFQAFVEQSNDIITVLGADGTYQYQSPSAQRILGYERGELIGENAFEYIHPEDREEVLGKFEQAINEPSMPPVVEYRFRHADGSWRWLESRGFNQLDNSAVEGFVVNSRDVTERKRHERQIADMHDATRTMFQATDAERICEIAVETAETILDHPIAGVWLCDESGERLEPITSTDAAHELIEEFPVYTEGNSLSWRAYETGEPFVTGDLREESGAYDPETELRSELIVPLGDYGVLNMGAAAVDAFTDNDIALAKLLGANTRAALGRNDRERLLERQTDQMEFFNSILRHDVLNAVTVIKSRAEFLEAELEGEQLRDVKTIISWSDDVQEIVQRVRTVLETLTGEGDPQLEPMQLGPELRAEIERVRATYPDASFDVDVPDGAPVLANDLLGDVLGNIVTNAVDHNDTAGLRVSVTAERRNDAVIVRIADNGRGVDDDRKEAIFRRGETGHAKSVGSGFGLFFVDAMVDEYGGEVSVEDNDDGGATFVIRLPVSESADST